MLWCRRMMSLISRPNKAAAQIPYLFTEIVYFVAKFGQITPCHPRHIIVRQKISFHFFIFYAARDQLGLQYSSFHRLWTTSLSRIPRRASHSWVVMCDRILYLKPSSCSVLVAVDETLEATVHSTCSLPPY